MLLSWQETRFICAEDCQVLENDFVVLSAFSNHCNAEVSLLLGHSLDTFINLGLGGMLAGQIGVKATWSTS